MKLIFPPYFSSESSQPGTSARRRDDRYPVAEARRLCVQARLTQLLRHRADGPQCV